MKLLLETTGDFMLVDPQTNSEIAWNRPSVCAMSGFIQMRMAAGQLKVIANDLDDSATDDEFVKFVAESKGDLELAKDSFISAFGPEAMRKKAEAAETAEKEAAEKAAAEAAEKAAKKGK